LKQVPRLVEPYIFKKVAEDFPIKQGLKLRSKGVLCRSDCAEVAEDFPIKQGLKPLYKPISWIDVVCCRRLSNKTRIETEILPWVVTFGEDVAEDFPIKQGLNLTEGYW